MPLRHNRARGFAHTRGGTQTRYSYEPEKMRRMAPKEPITGNHRPTIELNAEGKMKVFDPNLNEHIWVKI